MRDLPRAAVAGQQKGQMDCIDESTNTDTLLRYLAERGLLKYHKVERKASRGNFIDGRYPHFTAVVSDPAGVKWVVDSWYAPTGGAPDIFPYSQWKVRGQWESGALNLIPDEVRRKPIAETTTPAGGGDPAGVVFVAGYREEVAPTVFASSREEVGSDEIPFAVLKGAKPFLETTPAAGGGAAGAVSMASDREEVNAGRIRQGRGGGRPWRNSVLRSPCGRPT